MRNFVVEDTWVCTAMGQSGVYASTRLEGHLVVGKVKCLGFSGSQQVRTRTDLHVTLEVAKAPFLKVF